MANYKVNRHDFVPGKGAVLREVAEKPEPSERLQRLVQQYRARMDRSEHVWRPANGAFEGYTIFDVKDDGLVEIGRVANGKYQREVVAIEALHAWQLAAEAKRENEQHAAETAKVTGKKIDVLVSGPDLVGVYRGKMKVDESVLVERGTEKLPYKVVGVEERNGRWVVDLFGTVDGKPNYINGLEINQLDAWQKGIERKVPKVELRPEPKVTTKQEYKDVSPENEQRLLEVYKEAFESKEHIWVDDKNSEGPESWRDRKPFLVTRLEKKGAHWFVDLEGMVDGKPYFIKDLDIRQAPVIKKKVNIDIAAADISEEIENRAADVAEEVLNRDKAELKGVTGWFSKVWRYNIQPEFYRQMEIRRAKELILKDDNLYAADKAGKEAHTRATKAVVERYLSEYEEEMIHEEAGERKRVLGNKGAEGEVKMQLTDLIKSYATERSMSRGDLEDAAKRIFRQAGALDEETRAAGQMYATNVFEMAEVVRAQAAHAEGLNNLDIELSLTMGKAKLGARTERVRNGYESTLETMRKMSFGATDLFSNEISVALAVYYSTGVALARTALSSQAASLVSFGGASLAAGIVSGLTERSRLKRERALHERQRAVNMDYERGGLSKAEADAKRAQLQSQRNDVRWYQFGEKKRIEQELADLEKAPRREEMEKFSHEKMGATVTAGMLEALVVKEGDKTVLRANDADGFNVAMRVLGIIEARVLTSDRRKIDLFSYSGVANVETERLQLDIARARTKAALRAAYDGVRKEGDPSFDALLAKDVQSSVDLNDRDATEKDELFNKMRNKKALMRGVYTAAIGATVGAAIGSVFQEGWAAFSDSKHGIVDFLQDKYPAMQETMTPLAKLAAWMKGELPSIDGGHMTSQAFGGGEFKLPEGVDMVRESDGTYSLVFGDDHQQLIGGLEIGPDGQFTQESIYHLEDANIATFVDARTISGQTVTDGFMSKNEWMAEHPNDVNWIKRDEWMGNDTPMYRDPVSGKLLGADHNELRQYLVEKDGKLFYDMGKMTRDGSWQGGMRVDAQQAIEDGKMHLLLSFSEGTQNRPVDLLADPATGLAEITPDVRKALFAQVNGREVFLGRFAESAIEKGVDVQGRDHFSILATSVGKGVEGDVPSWIRGDETHEIPVTIFDFPVDHPVDLPPIIPILSRDPLERMKVAGPLGYGMYYEGNRPEWNEMFDKNRSKTLKENPKAELDSHKELKDYFERSPKDHVAMVKELVAQLGPMSKDIKMSICIPVAGHQEEKNIYQSLKNFTYQTAKKNEFEVVLFVNHPEKDKEGRMVKPDGTIKEIDRFKAEHPDMPIKVMYKQLPIEDARISLIRKLLNDAVAMRQLERGEGAPDLIMVSNDADNKGVSPDYIQNFIERFELQPDVDGMLGQLDWDPEAYTKYPHIHIGTRLFQYLNIIGRHNSGGMTSSGANFAFRSGIYAGIGGYRPEITDGGEDVAIGKAIIRARGDNRGSIAFAGAGKSRVYTSARRAIDAAKAGLPPVIQWDRGFSAFDDEIRRMSLDGGKDIDYSDPKVVTQLKVGLERVINSTLDVYEKEERKAGGGLGKKSRYYARALGLMGIEYSLDAKDDVVITNIDKVVEGLREYQKIAVMQRDAKSGKPEARGAWAKRTVERKAAKVSESTSENVQAKVDFDKKLVELLPEKLSLQMERTSISADLVEKTTQSIDIGGKYVGAGDLALSEGVTGRVVPGYRVRDRQPVVIKEMSADAWKGAKKIARGDDVEKYLAEKGFSHPNVALPLERFEDNGAVTRVYEAGATDLENYVLEKGRMAPKQAIEVLLRACNGIRALHEAGVIHGDIAPSNIILSEDDVKVTDLDVSAVVKGDWLVTRDGFVGNRFISPPEMFKEQPAFDKTADTYEVSSVLYYLLTGKWPYFVEGDKRMPIEQRNPKYAELHEKSQIEFPADMPEALQDIIRKGMSPERKNRYQTMDAFMSDLTEVYSKVK